MSLPKVLDIVQESSLESMPASDPPGWIQGSATPERPGPPALEPRFGRRPTAARTLAEGLVAGLVGYLAVVVAIGALDVLRGEPPFHTASLLGAWLFYRSGEAAVAPWPGPALAYNGVHFLVSLLAGLAAAFLVLEVELHRALWYLALMAFIAATVSTIALLGVAGVEVAGALEWSTVVAGTAVWLLSMVAYLAVAHRRLLGRIGEDLKGES